ncbi:MAG: hypothetical protein ACT6U0_00840 [Shinella sp.]|uniref:hypothetical protein n=1 Tax=Shinella sp. TaxID=1870904 RepID=UPI00403504C1
MNNPEQNSGDKKHRHKQCPSGERHRFAAPFRMKGPVVHAHAMMEKDHPRRERWKSVVRKIFPHGGTSADGSP